MGYMRTFFGNCQESLAAGQIRGAEEAITTHGKCAVAQTSPAIWAKRRIPWRTRFWKAPEEQPAESASIAAGTPARPTKASACVGESAWPPSQP